jgi:flagellar basal body-associated protein FliL
MADPTENKGAPNEPVPGGGLKAWLPLILMAVLMPALAYAMTSFVLLPKLKKALGVETVSAREGESAGHDATSDGKPEPKHGAKSEGKKDGGPGSQDVSRGKGPKIKVPLTKIVVNVSGSLGTRLLLASFTLVGSGSDFKIKVEESTDQLRDIAASILGSKTIADLEKPEARNLIRAELLSQFNSALGGGVHEIYITEFAIQ